MSKNQWYVHTEGSIGYVRHNLIQYTPTKQDAEKLLKQVKKIDKLCYVDFVWKSDLHLPFSKLHGKTPIKVESIMDVLIPLIENDLRSWNKALI